LEIETILTVEFVLEPCKGKRSVGCQAMASASTQRRALYSPY